MTAALVQLLAVRALVLPPTAHLRTTTPRAPVASAQALGVEPSDLRRGAPPAVLDASPRRLAEEDPATWCRAADPPPRGARPHQQKALEAIRRHYSSARDGSIAQGPPVGAAGAERGEDDGRRATVVLPPGAGKTLIGMWAIERELRPGEAALVVLPTLPLIDQARGLICLAAPCPASLCARANRATYLTRNPLHLSRRSPPTATSRPRSTRRAPSSSPPTAPIRT